MIYPFIVNNPGEAAQAKRRIGAATIGHLTPPLIAAGSHGAALELEGLFDEFVQAQGLDPRRARAIAALILERGQATGLLKECAAEGKPPEEALIALDGWLCDLKDMRVGDGLHVFGRSPETAEGFASGLELDGEAAETLRERVAACGAGKSLGLVRALAGRFVAPGPAGAPARGRFDVLPTGRNLFAIDPRSAPTRNAWEIGRRAAGEVLARYAQDHGAWPKRIVLDLWGSATMRTGGDDLAQAFALLGCRPAWDMSSNRVSGFEILPLAMLGRPRVDVTLRISGLFRDVFPSQIALFDAAVRAVAELEEGADDNPLAGLRGASLARVFGAPPGAYGVGLGRRISQGQWAGREDLAEAYLSATSHAYDGGGEGREAAAAFRARWPVPMRSSTRRTCRVRMRSTPTPFPSTRAASPRRPPCRRQSCALPSRFERARDPKIRPLEQEIARALRGRAANPRWLAGQMRHGHRGAAEIAQSLDNLYAFAALTDAVRSAQFDLMFDATLGDDPCARSSSAPTLRLRGIWRACSRRPSGAASGARAAIRRRAFWRRSCGRPHERDRASPERLVSRGAEADGDRRRAARAGARLRREAHA